MSLGKKIVVVFVLLFDAKGLLCGARGLADLYKTLEAMGRKADLTEAPTLRQQLEIEHERVVTALRLETWKGMATL